MHYRIALDDFDRAEAPHDPITLNVYADAGTEGWEQVDDALVGKDVPSLLRELADNWGSYHA